MTELFPLSAAEVAERSDVVRRSADYFAHEPAAVSMVVRVAGGFAAVARVPYGAEVVGVFPTEDAAQAALRKEA